MTKVPVTIRYTSPGLQPPVFIFTDLSDPSWEAVEMEVSHGHQGACHFTKHFQVTPGEYQYKFRLGTGDWWQHDVNKPTVDDGFGNKNNFIQVNESAGETPAVQHGQLPVKSESPHKVHSPHEAATHESDEEDHPPLAPLLPHEMITPHGNTYQPYPDIDPPKGWSDDEGEEDPADRAPLLPHEMISPHTTYEERHGYVAPKPDNDYDSDDAEPFQSPLLPHERDLGMPRAHPPAYDTESSSKPAFIDDPEHPDFDHNNPNLVPFPTTREGIFDLIHSIAASRPLDEPAEHTISIPSSPARSSRPKSTMKPRWKTSIPSRSSQPPPDPAPQ